jgi:lysophospholipase L1-like esterase
MRYHRFNLVQWIARRIASFRQIKYLLIGDSLTAEGFNWGPKLGESSLSALNLGASGHVISQIQIQLDTAATLKPKFVLVLAGTNDYQRGRTDEEILSDFERFLNRANQLELRDGVVTSIPVQADSTEDERLLGLNAKLKQLVAAGGWRFVDLNLAIMDNRDRAGLFQEDHIHFSQRMYDLWARELRTAVGETEL